LIRVLQLTYRVPFPPTDGGAIGIYNITKGLFENGCKIDLVAINTPKHSQPKDAMAAFARQFDVLVDTNISKKALLKNLLFSKIPYNVERFINADVANTLRQLLSENNYDFIQIEGAFVVYYIDLIKELTDIPILVRTHNIEYIIWQRLALNESNIFKKWYFNLLAKRLKKFEKKYYNKADAIAAITFEDEQRLKKMGVDVPIQIIPAGVELKKYNHSEAIVCEENSMFSISALDWMPNIEGLDWFLKNIWPEVHRTNPKCTFHVAGKSTPEKYMNMQIPNVFFHGFVDNAELFKKKYQLMLVPLLSGGGMRIKIIEGMAAEKCILSTAVGAEGIICENNKDIIIADTPKEWIQSINELLNNTNKIEQIAKEALKTVTENYDNKTVTKKYIDLYYACISQN
jgi:glycosyltransferase involved in cell wall biosynthesis